MISRESLARFARVADVLLMSGVDFELFVRDCLLAKGYTKVETTRKSGDFGADLIILQDQAPKKIVIQCKRSVGTVGVRAVQEVLGAKRFYKATEAWVVTDATFTPAAIKLARSCGVRLRRLLWSANR
jgi:restriction system protein